MDIMNSLERAVNEVFDWIPNLIAALVILLIGWIVAKVLAWVVRKVLAKVGFDRMTQRPPTGEWIGRVTDRPSGFLGTLTFWVVFLGALSLALTQLEIAALDRFLAAVWGYLPHVLAALAIFLIAAAVAMGASTIARKTLGDTPLGRVAATAIPILVMTIATFMILVELQLGETIVMITYAGLIGALALGSALAFGLGGREVAREMLGGAYEQGKERKEEFRRDMDRGVDRAREERERTAAGGPAGTPPA